MAEPTDTAFADAFARLAEIEDGKPIPADFNAPVVEAPAAPPTPEAAPVASEAAETPVEAGEAAPVASEAAETPVEAGEAAPVTAAVEPSPKTPAMQPAPQISDEELLKRFASLVRQPPAPEAPRQPVAPAPIPPLFNDDEQKFLLAYDKDWPDVSRAEALRRRADLNVAIGYVFNEIAKEFGPVIQGYRQIAERQQVNDLRSYAQDYDQVRDQVVGWVDTQPEFMRPAMKDVIANGTFEQVTALMDMWRKSAQPASPPQAPVVPKTPLPISDAAKKAAAALAPVGGKRSGAVRGAPETFEDAFAEYAKEMSKAS